MTLLTYGPFEKKSSFSQEELNGHFLNKNKFFFLTLTRLVRVIEISHWGNMTIEEIEENIDLLHTEVLLKGLQLF